MRRQTPSCATGEQEFTQLKPVKRRGNRRYYQHHEVLLVRRIPELLHNQGFTISGARNRWTKGFRRGRRGKIPWSRRPSLPACVPNLLPSSTFFAFDTGADVRYNAAARRGVAQPGSALAWVQGSRVRIPPPRPKNRGLAKAGPLSHWAAGCVMLDSAGFGARMEAKGHERLRKLRREHAGDRTRDRAQRTHPRHRLGRRGSGPDPGPEAIDHAADVAKEVAAGQTHDPRLLAKLDLFGLAAVMLRTLQESADEGFLSHGGPAWKAFARALWAEVESRPGKLTGTGP